jgi:hypothetical protein
MSSKPEKSSMKQSFKLGLTTKSCRHNDLQILLNFEREAECRAKIPGKPLLPLLADDA